MNKKAQLEIIEPEFGSSFAVKHFTEPSLDPKNKFWHFHPELELVYIKGGNGKRHIGNHLSCYYDGDLILIGSNLPHYGFTNRLSGNDSETIIQMKSDFLGKDFLDIPEMRHIAQLFERAKYGIVYTGKAKYDIGAKIEELVKLDTFDRLAALLSILHKMATTDNYEVLNALEYSFEVKLEDNDRPEIIYNYVRKNFLETIPLEAIALEVNMTVPAFCRYFKKLSGKTFTKFVNEYRVVHACKLLSEEKISITEVCFRSGFNNFSHFTKVFKEVAGLSPSDYRKKVTALV
ncbi:MAG: helix-turn-helix transcriptional regulator [Saprospiraceae bacterium]|nr:helix-turn-helix transcriptional regulator [Saprospiraceae bacterium]